MSQNSKIQWTDHTFNPWIGCTKVSPGCANCYAETQDNFRKWTPEGWGKGKPRKRTSAANWKTPVTWERAAALAKNTDPDWRAPRVFCASLADWLDPDVPIEWLADLLDLIRRTPHLDWLLLTKRPELWEERLRAVVQYYRGIPNELTLGKWLELKWLDGKAPINIWLGTSVEDQQRADKRIQALLSIPAAVHFLSMEPLLGPIDLSPHLEWGSAKWWLEPTDWVILGGESGPNARPCNIEWLRAIRDQCQAAGVPVFVKQLGVKSETDNPYDVEHDGPFPCYMTLQDRKGGNPDEWPEDLRLRQFPKSA